MEQNCTEGELARGSLSFFLSFSLTFSLCSSSLSSVPLLCPYCFSVLIHLESSSVVLFDRMCRIFPFLWDAMGSGGATWTAMWCPEKGSPAVTGVESPGIWPTFCASNTHVLQVGSVSARKIETCQWKRKFCGWVIFKFNTVNPQIFGEDSSRLEKDFVKKIAPWSLRWFEEISFALIWLALIWLALIWLALIWVTQIWLALIWVTLI